MSKREKRVREIERTKMEGRKERKRTTLRNWGVYKVLLNKQNR